MPPGVEHLVPHLREQYQRSYDKTSKNAKSAYTTLFPKMMQLERAFVRAGGTLVAGTDPTGSGGVRRSWRSSG